MKFDILGLLLFYITSVAGKKSIYFVIPRTSYCSGPSSLRFNEVDGAIVRSVRVKTYKNCILRLTTDSKIFTKKKFMVKFTQLNIKNCRTKLQLYNQKHTTIAPMKTLTCGSPLPKILYTNSKYLTIELRPGGATDFSFTMVITSYENKGFCNELRCNNGKCIDKDLRCDGYDNCFDRTDESSLYCSTNVRCDEKNTTMCNNGSLRGVKTTMKTMLIGILVAISIVVVLIVVCVVCCVKKGFNMFSGRGSRHANAAPTVQYEAAPVKPPCYPTAVNYPAQQQYPPQMNQYPQQPYPPSQPGGYPPQQTSPYPPAPAGVYPPYGTGQPPPYPPEPTAPLLENHDNHVPA